MVDYLPDLESTCSALGTSDGQTYIRDDDCVECLKDVIRFLRRDDANHEIRRRLGEIQVVQSDLIPLLRDYGRDEEVFDLVLRVLVNLTNPELLLYREELPEDKAGRNYYIQLQSHRQKYKAAFVDEKVWVVLKEKLQSLLGKGVVERLEDEQLVIERILILVRNVLQVPRDPGSESALDTDISMHDQILWVLRKSEMQDLLLYIASSAEELQYCLHVLEIISLMFREQEPKHLAAANFQRSKEEKEEDQKALLIEVQREQAMRRQKVLQSSSRHSRFGGTFTVANMASITDGRKIVSHRPLQNLNSLDFDRSKRPKRLAKNKMAPKEDLKRRSSLAVRLFLKEFCIEFLTGAYNPLMVVVKDNLSRNRAQQNDESYYLWAIRFFMEFNRHYEFRADVVSETLDKPTFHYVQQQIDLYKDNFEHEKRNRAAYLLWSKRMHLALRAYQELLSTLVAMDKSSSEAIRESSKRLKVKVFYEPEYRELCLSLFGAYKVEKFSKGFLKDLVETNHVFLKIMEHMAASKQIVLGKKVRKRKAGAGKKSKRTAQIVAAEVSIRESKEDLWERVSAQVSELLQNDDDPLPAVSPYDESSGADPTEEQKDISLYRIQRYLKQRNAAMALALLRASRQVWPEGEAFGEEDAEPEDEFMLLREILFTDRERPAGFVADSNEDDAVPGAEDPRDSWMQLSSQLRGLFEDADAELPSVSPFDAASDIPMEEQKVISLYRIQQHLKEKKTSKALALLRASREVWPEGDVFGSPEIETDHELQLLHELFQSDMARPAGYVEEIDLDAYPDPLADSENEDDESNDEEAEFFAGEDERDGAAETLTVDQEFDFRQLVMRFASKGVCMAYDQLFRDYRNNSAFTNHCIMKMFHRIAYDCKHAALLFQVSIFRTFQKLNQDRRVLKDASTISEMHKFARFLLSKFFETAEKNKKVFMETCFWKTSSEAVEIVDGYDASGSKATARQKASFWSEEDEEKLERFFHQFQEMRERPAGEGPESEPPMEGDIVDNMEPLFLESGKTRRQIIRKLKDMNLIQSVKDLRPKKAGRQRRAKAGSGRRRRGGQAAEEQLVDSDNDGDTRPPETDAQGNPIYKSKEWISTDDDSSSDEDLSRPKPSENSKKPNSSDSDSESDAGSDPINRPLNRVPKQSSRTLDSSSSESEADMPGESPKRGTPLKSPNLTLRSPARRSLSPNSTLDYSRNTRRSSLSPFSTPGNSRLDTPNTSRRYRKSSSSSRSTSPLSAVAGSSLSTSPVRSRTATPMSSVSKRRRAPSSNSTQQSAGKKKKRRYEIPSFLGSSSSDSELEPEPEKENRSSPLRTARIQLDSDEGEDEPRPVMQTKRRHAAIIESDSD